MAVSLYDTWIEDGPRFVSRCWSKPVNVPMVDQQLTRVKSALAASDLMKSAWAASSDNTTMTGKAAWTALASRSSSWPVSVSVLVLGESWLALNRTVVVVVRGKTWKKTVLEVAGWQEQLEVDRNYWNSAKLRSSLPWQIFLTILIMNMFKNTNDKWIYLTYMIGYEVPKMGE